MCQCVCGPAGIVGSGGTPLDLYYVAVSLHVVIGQQPVVNLYTEYVFKSSIWVTKVYTGIFR